MESKEIIELNMKYNPEFKRFAERMELDLARFWALAEYFGYEFDGTPESVPANILQDHKDGDVSKFIVNDEEEYRVLYLGWKEDKRQFKIEKIN